MLSTDYKCTSSLELIVIVVETVLSKILPKILVPLFSLMYLNSVI